MRGTDRVSGTDRVATGRRVWREGSGSGRCGAPQQPETRDLHSSRKNVTTTMAIKAVSESRENVISQKMDHQKQLFPCETLCQVCPEHPKLDEAVLITNKARIVSMMGVIENVSTHHRLCPQCHMVCRYQTTAVAQRRLSSQGSARGLRECRNRAGGVFPSPISFGGTTAGEFAVPAPGTAALYCGHKHCPAVGPAVCLSRRSEQGSGPLEAEAVALGRGRHCDGLRGSGCRGSPWDRVPFHQERCYILGGDERCATGGRLCCGVLGNSVHVCTLLPPQRWPRVHARFGGAASGGYLLSDGEFYVPRDTSGISHPLCLLPLAVRRERNRTEVTV
ncbi:uncharacterized protein [Nothobranchius furzeri]|uniref:uncharacterized protein isoform X4 n=1 Tax=Nothobranchius furzeri TaxID=105023 RepID=UPI0039049320